MAQTAVGTRPAPFVPNRLVAGPPVRATTRARSRSGQAGGERVCWDLRWSADGHRGFRRFEHAADADVFRSQLLTAHGLGHRYSPAAGRFIAPEVALGHAMTLAEWTDHYWQWKWPTLQPAGRPELARYLNRVRGHFVTIAPVGEDADAVRAYLRASLRADTKNEVPLNPIQQLGRTLLAERSVPLSSIGRAELEEFIDRCRYHYRQPGTAVAPATIRRMAADLRQCWDRAVIEGVLASNPWHVIRLRNTPAAASTPVVAADADLVLSPNQVMSLAQACVDRGTWGEEPRALILVMGFCGLRPSEAVGLVRADIDLEDPNDAWLTVRRSRRRVPTRFLDPTEDARWGPLKSKPAGATRRIPVPAVVVPALRDHIALLDGQRPFDLVFEHHGKPVDLDKFNRDVWRPARQALFPHHADLPADSPLQPKLARLRRHDLRHAACSMWLRSGIDIKICQRWSGHSRLSVFLDIYQGLIPGHEDRAAHQINAALDHDRPIQGDTSPGQHVIRLRDQPH